MICRCRLIEYFSSKMLTTLFEQAETARTQPICCNADMSLASLHLRLVVPEGSAEPYGRNEYTQGEAAISGAGLPCHGATRISALHDCAVHCIPAHTIDKGPVCGDSQTSIMQRVRTPHDLN